MAVSMPMVSIVVPVYNVETYLSQCLDSLIAQTYKNIEIVCINDGSTDRSLDILNAYAAKDTRIKVITKTNGGVSSARNYARGYIAGRYVMYIDSDDWIDTQTCEKAVSWAEAYTADVVFWNYVREFPSRSRPRMLMGNTPIVVCEPEEISHIHRRFLGLYKSELQHPESANALDPVWGKLYRAEFILKNQLEFVDIKAVGTGEDGLFNLHYFQYVHCAVYLPDCFNHYRKFGDSITRKYKGSLPSQWETLHQAMRYFLTQSGNREDFSIALNNRISLSIIGLGLNVLLADKTVNKRREIKKILSTPEYRMAVRTLELRYFPIHWKVFFAFAKYNFATGVYSMLWCIQKLKA